VAMTAHALEGDRERCVAAGMDDYIAKPVKPELLDETLRRWLDIGAGLSASEAARTQGDEPAAVFNREELLDRIGGDEPFMEELLDLYVEDTGRSIRLLMNRSPGDPPETLQRLAHTIKGSSANTAAPAMRAAAAELEKALRNGEENRIPDLVETLAREFHRFRSVVRKTGG